MALYDSRIQDNPGGEKPEIDIRMFKPGGSLRAELSSSALRVTYDAWEFVLSPPVYRVRYQKENLSLELNLKSLGTPFWFNQGKEEGCRKSPSTVAWGSEVLCDVEGFLTLDGRRIAFTGNGVFDNGISPNISWLESIWQDYVWFVFDDIYGLLYYVHGSRYKDGDIPQKPKRVSDCKRPGFGQSPMGL